MSRSLVVGVGPTGELRAIAVTDLGEVKVSGGGGGGSAGTEYTEGATDATITGTAMMWEDASDTIRAVSGLHPLPVSIAGLMSALDELEGKIQALSDRLPSALVAGRLSVDGSGVIQPVAGDVIVANFPNTQAISAISLPLPDGAATNTTLVQVRDRIPTLGAKPAASSLPVVLSSDGPFATNFGQVADAAASTDTGSFSFLAFIKRLLSVTLGANSDAGSATGSLAAKLRALVEIFTPISSNAYTFDHFSSLGSAVSTVVKNSPGNIKRIRIINISPSATYFFQLHNKATTLATNDVPALPAFDLSPGSVYEFEFPSTGHFFSIGITFGISTTRRLYTAGTAADVDVSIYFK